MKILSYLHIAIFSFLFLSCSSKEKTQEDIRTDLIYSLINEILSDTTIWRSEKYCLSEVTLLFPDPPNSSVCKFYNDLFNEDDTVNIYQQLILRREFLIDSLKIGGMKILSKKDIIVNSKISDEFFWSYIHENCERGYISFSMPVFSKDNSLVYIKFGYMCERLWGEGESRLYKREDDEWIFIKSPSRWVS